MLLFCIYINLYSKITNGLIVQNLLMIYFHIFSVVKVVGLFLHKNVLNYCTTIILIRWYMVCLQFEKGDVHVYWINYEFDSCTSFVWTFGCSIPPCVFKIMSYTAYTAPKKAVWNCTLNTNLNVTSFGD